MIDTNVQEKLNKADERALRTQALEFATSGQQESDDVSNGDSVITRVRCYITFLRGDN
jgi:hypothetical protein